jgi:hypothetical protein
VSALLSNLDKGKQKRRELEGIIKETEKAFTNEKHQREELGHQIEVKLDRIHSSSPVELTDDRVAFLNFLGVAK